MLDDQSKVVLRYRHIVSTSGVHLHYSEYLPQAAPRSDILLVHGLASSGQQFDLEALHFATAGYRALVPDLRGHGLSGVPTAMNNSDFTIAAMAGDMVEMLDHAGARQVHWVGNSLGGILALWLLGTPDVDRLLSLALFGTCFSMNLPAPVGLVLRAAFLPGKSLTARLTALTTTGSARGRDAVSAAIRQFNVLAGAAIAENVRHYDFHANVRSYDRPVLVMWGGLDRAVNMRLRGDLKRLADCGTILRVDLPTAGHCANFDMYDEFCSALQKHWSAPWLHCDNADFDGS